MSNFNKNARKYAANKNIELIDEDALINMMNLDTN
ncbi:restriction endonuclease [Bacillus cereus]|nr:MULTISPECIES: restriction endonuclease [unclassified Bacillus (in: firmicutes)]MCU0096537.1 restriction endonuclease [Bacillus sp. OR9]MCU4760140.1 restriction endonuclease [Bacillus cereus]MCU5109245.1 restriction endonuclease [Bacillus cereus]MCU5342334.1 restriction endonuclease [Bacillus cereus]MDF2017165.1 restriction endonuclease [Bacillus sp. Cr_R3]